MTSEAADARSDQELVRREKLARLRSSGRDPYAFGYPRTTDITSLRAEYPDLDADTFTGDVVGVAGRVV
jgi:lysyl-tRNA synthetase class 2